MRFVTGAVPAIFVWDNLRVTISRHTRPPLRLHVPHHQSPPANRTKHKLLSLIDSEVSLGNYLWVQGID